MKLFILLFLLISCAKETSEKLTEKRRTKGKKLVQILHTNHYFKQSVFGEKYVIEAQIRSLSPHPIKNIMLDVTVFDKNSNLIAKRREAVRWKKNRKKDKTKKPRGYLSPGESRVCEITFYASQIEPESKLEKKQRTLNKKFKKPRKKNFTSIFPEKYNIVVFSAKVVD